MAAASDYWEDVILDSLLDATLYLALSTADPGEDGTGIAEPSGGGYARAQILTTDWAAASGGAKSTDEDIAFGAPSGNWGTITHIALFDAVSGGNMLLHAELAYSKEILSGASAPTFAAGDLTVSID